MECVFIIRECVFIIMECVFIIMESCPSRGRIPLEVQPLSRNPSLAAAPSAPVTPGDIAGTPQEMPSLGSCSSSGS